MPKSAKQVTSWVFTLFDSEPPEFDPEHCRYLCYQQERCPTTNRLHWQSFVQFKRSRTLAFVQRTCGRGTKCHAEPARSDVDAREYCRKTDTSIPDSFKEHGTFIVPGSTPSESLVAAIKKGKSNTELLDEVPGIALQHWNKLAEIRRALRPPQIQAPDITLTAWQESVLLLLDGPPVRRRIIWIWSDESETGKSTFYDYCQARYCGSVLPATDKWVDSIHAYNDHRIVWFDIPRHQFIDSVLLQQLERFSNGGIQPSSKYHSTTKLVSAHVVVTSNEAPPHVQLPRRIVEIHADKVFGAEN